jgi:hypothetical protein
MKSYLSVLEEENKSSVVSGTEKLVGDLPGKTKEHVSANKVEGVEEPVEGPHSQQDPESEPKTVKSESTNPFDDLYNKVLAEEAWDFEEADTQVTDNSVSPEMPQDDFNMEFGTDMKPDTEEEEAAPEGMEAVLDHLKKAVEALEQLVGENEGEEEEDLEEEGTDMEEDMEEDMPTEAVEAEVEGHALVDQEKLAKGLDKPTSATVKGAVPVTKGKAQVVKGAKVDGKPSELKCNPEELANKAKQNVNGVKTGKGLFDQ